MLGGRLPETENERICQTSGLKTGRGRFIKYFESRWSLTRELLEQYLTEKENGYLQSGHSRKVVA